MQPANVNDRTAESQLLTEEGRVGADSQLSTLIREITSESDRVSVEVHRVFRSTYRTNGDPAVWRREISQPSPLIFSTNPSLEFSLKSQRESAEASFELDIGRRLSRGDEMAGDMTMDVSSEDTNPSGRSTVAVALMAEETGIKEAAFASELKAALNSRTVSANQRRVRMTERMNVSDVYR